MLLRGRAVPGGIPGGLGARGPRRLRSLGRGGGGAGLLLRLDLLEEVLPEDEASASTTPEAAEATGTASPEPTGDPTGDSAATQEHAFSVYSPGSGTVTALGERVRMTFRGGCAVLTEHHEAEGTTTYTFYRADTLDLGGL